MLHPSTLLRGPALRFGNRGGEASKNSVTELVRALDRIDNGNTVNVSRLVTILQPSCASELTRRKNSLNRAIVWA